MNYSLRHPIEPVPGKTYLTVTGRFVTIQKKVCDTNRLYYVGHHTELMHDGTQEFIDQFFPNGQCTTTQDRDAKPRTLDLFREATADEVSQAREDSE